MLPNDEYDPTMWDDEPEDITSAGEWPDLGALVAEKGGVEAGRARALGYTKPLQLNLKGHQYY